MSWCRKEDWSSYVRTGQLASEVDEPHGDFEEETRIGDEEISQALFISSIFDETQLEISECLN
jgi:hypothetical protein